MKNKRLIIYADGASRGNPGPAGAGAVIIEGRKKVKELSRYLGETTNNVAEYNAVIMALEAALAMKADEVLIRVDSELVVKQLNGEYRVKDEEIRKLFEKVLGILRIFSHFEVRHVGRAGNKDADKLANKAINLSSLF